jgi:hypothetical protein
MELSCGAKRFFVTFSNPNRASPIAGLRARESVKRWATLTSGRTTG